MANVLNHEKKSQIEALGRLGWSLRRIEAETGVRRETTSRYLKLAGIVVRERRRRRLQGLDGPGDPVLTVAPAPGGGLPPAGPKAASEPTSSLERPSGPRTASGCEPYREWITEELDKRRRITAIYQGLVERHGFDHSYECVKRFVRRIRKERGVQPAHPRIETPPGEEAQVDYGTGPMVRDPKTGKYRRTRLFAMTLGFSRRAVWRIAWKSSVEIWCRLHEESFQRIGGVPKVIILDNLREGVVKPDIYDPEINRLYADMLRHYGCVALPARVRHPDRKGKVESSVGYAQGTALAGQRFETMDAANEHLDNWTERWADVRIHGTTKEQVRARFELERPHLLALPCDPFTYWKEGLRRVGLDGYVEVEAAYYSTPPGCIGQDLRAQWDERRVRLLDPTTGELLREHWKTTRGSRRQEPEDRPHKTPPTTIALLARAKGSGPAVGSLCAAMHASDGEMAVRRIQGVISLVRKHGPTTVDRACSDAMELGCADYRAVKKLLDRRRETAVGLKQTDDLIRQLTIYRDIVADITPSPKA
jgi:transposase